jgi:hypothetical protein
LDYFWLGDAYGEPEDQGLQACQQEDRLGHDTHQALVGPGQKFNLYLFVIKDKIVIIINL